MKQNTRRCEQKPRFLVTGGAGFIGSNLCEALLKREFMVVCLDNMSTGKLSNIMHLLDEENFLLIEGDIRDLEICLRACDGVDYVMHQAALGSVPRSIELPLLYEEVNIQGTLNMLEASRIQGVKRFIYASSSSVYGDDLTLPKREGVEGKLLSPYALTKYVNEEYAQMYWALYRLPTIGLRYFNVYGPRQDPEGAYAAVIPKFLSQLLRGEQPTIYGDGKQSRDFTYVQDVIQANLKSYTAPAQAFGQTFNIANGGQYSLLDLLASIAKLLEVRVDPIFLSPRDGDIRHSNADISKARNLLEFDPQWSFERGIRESLVWYKTELRLNRKIETT